MKWIKIVIWKDEYASIICQLIPKNKVMVPVIWAFCESSIFAFAQIY